MLQPDDDHTEVVSRRPSRDADDHTEIGSMGGVEGLSIFPQRETRAHKGSLRVYLWLNAQLLAISTASDGSPAAGVLEFFHYDQVDDRLK